MRKYDKKTNELELAVCNCCGKQLLIENGVLKEGICSVDVTWGYFSKKDTSIHHFDLCEECYDKLTAQFAVPVKEEEETEQACKNLV